MRINKSRYFLPAALAWTITLTQRAHSSPVDGQNDQGNSGRHSILSWTKERKQAYDGGLDLRSELGRIGFRNRLLLSIWRSGDLGVQRTKTD